MKFVWIVFFVFFLNRSGAVAEPLVHCEPMRRDQSAHGQSFIDRGVRIHLEVRDPEGTSLEHEDSVTLWFGRSQESRDHGLRVCRDWADRLACRHDGPSRTSYGRGSSSSTTTHWALHGEGGAVLRTFEGPFLPFMDSAVEQCWSALLDEIANQVRAVGGRGRDQERIRKRKK